MISAPVTRSFDSAYGPSVTTRSGPRTALPRLSRGVPTLPRPWRASSSAHAYHFFRCAWSTEGETSSRDTAPPRKISMYPALGSAGSVGSLGPGVTAETRRGAWGSVIYDHAPVPAKRGDALAASRGSETRWCSPPWAVIAVVDQRAMHGRGIIDSTADGVDSRTEGARK